MVNTSDQQPTTHGFPAVEWTSSHLDLSLRERGYACVRANSPDVLAETMLAIAALLGHLVPSRKGKPVLDSLKVLAQDEALPRSLSRLHGRGPQPWHMDGAHLPAPPRYLLLGCSVLEGNGAPRTELLRMDSVALLSTADAHREPFIVRNGGSSFYSTIASRDRVWARYDPGCMTPLSDRGRSLANALLLEDVTPCLAFEWSRGDILVFDNQALFHRRSAPRGAGCRELMRLSVMEKQ